MQQEERTVNEPQKITNIIKTPEKSLGTIYIPKINLKKEFYDINSQYNSVNKGIEVINPSQMPDINMGNLILASHSGNSPISYFKNLDKLKENEEIQIIYKQKRYIYKIKTIYKVVKHGSIEILRNKNKTCLTLITCDKTDKNKQIVIIGELEK